MSDEIFYFSLHERRNNILSLSSHWSNPLASSARFDSQTSAAIALAERLSGGHPQISLVWLSPTTIAVETPEDAPEEAHTDGSEIIDPQGTTREPEQEIIVDLLSEEPGLLDEDPANGEPTITATIFWELPEVCLILLCVLETDGPNARTCLWTGLQYRCQTTTIPLLVRSSQSNNSLEWMAPTVVCSRQKMS